MRLNTASMIQALIQILFFPNAAWRNLAADKRRQFYILPMLVLPLLILASLSTFIPYFYQYITLSQATKEALLTLFKYSASMLSATLSFYYLARYNFSTKIEKNKLYIFVGYTFVIWFLTIIVGNLLPSKFTFVQFAPMYIIWVVYQAREYLKIPSDTTLTYTVLSSMVIIGMPSVWGIILGSIIK